MSNKPSFLIDKNDFFTGVSRLFDIASTRNKRIYSKYPFNKEADEKALLNDWNVVGNDIRGAYNEFKKEVKTHS